MLLDSGMVAIDTACCCGGGACCLPPCCPDVASPPFDDGVGNCYQTLGCDDVTLYNPVACDTLWLGLRTDICCNGGTGCDVCGPHPSCNNCADCPPGSVFSCDEYYDPATCEFVSSCPNYCAPSACGRTRTLTHQCSDDGACLMISADDCTATGGFFHIGVTCDPNPCLGACCIGGVCSLLTEATCALFGGIYQGGGTICIPNPC